MLQDLSHFRKVYQRNSLDEQDVPGCPIELFQAWFEQAREQAPDREPNILHLSTLDADGYPQSRVMLLKRFGEEGFVFFTNYRSNKAANIAQHPKVGVSFFWEASERQVIIRGKIEKVSDQESQEYFATRPRGSQLGAWASRQSAVIDSRASLEAALLKAEEKYPSEVPRPDHWGGYLVLPEVVEFWQGRPNRLHDRIRYTKQDKAWQINRLAP